MLANLSKRLGNHPDYSERLFHLAHTELSQDPNITRAFTASRKEARGRGDNGKGKNDSKIFGHSHPVCKE